MLPRRKVVAGIAVLGAVVLLGPAAARGAVPDTTASRVPVTISATSLSVDQLVYVDTVPVPTAAGPVATLELDLTGASFEGLTLALPCVPIQLGGLTGRTTTDGTTTAAGLTVYATDVAATIGGTQVRLSSTDPAYPPPPAGTVLVSNDTVTEPTMVAVLVLSSALTLPSLTTSAGFCTPGAAKPLAGTPLAGTPLAGVPAAPATSGSAEPAAPSTPGGSGGSSGHGEPSAPPSDTSTPLPSPQPSGDATTPSPPPSSDPAPVPVPEPSPTP